MAGRRKAKLGALAVLLSACGSDCPTPKSAAAPSVGISSPVVEVAAAPSIGTRHPYIVLEVDPEGRYVVLCQAREDTDGDGEIRTSRGIREDWVGDEMKPYWVERGEGRRLDRFVARSESGRYAVIVEGGATLLVDAATHQTVPLRDAVRSDSESGRPELSSSLAFSEDERHLVYLVTREGRTAAVAHELPSHRERSLPVVPELLSGLSASPDPRWVVLQTLTEQQRKAVLATLYPSHASDGCAPPGLGYSSRLAESIATRWLVPLAGGAPVAAAQYLMPLGDSLLRRAPDGALWLDRPGADKTEIAPASCGAIVERASSRAVLVACQRRAANENAAAPLYLWHGERLSPLGVAVSHPEDAGGPSFDRFWPLRAQPLDASASPKPAAVGASDDDDDDCDTCDGYAQFVFDSQLAKLSLLGARELLEETYESKLLLRRDDTWLLRDTTSGETKTLTEQTLLHPLLRNGRFAFASPALIDLEEGKVVGEYAGEALAVSATGQLLLAPSVPPPAEPSPAMRYIVKLIDGVGVGYTNFPFGPLRWVSSTKTP